MKFDRAEMAHLQEMRCLTTDALGYSVYAGLTRLESEEYFALTRPGGADRQVAETSLAHSGRRARFLALHHRMRNAQLRPSRLIAALKPFAGLITNSEAS